jgi:VIT1/CCC1 family predicted Fe2+/Mn2+ transporter
VIPFIFMTDAVNALRVSNLIAVAMLFAAGYAFGRITGGRPWVVGISMVLLGAVLVALTIALGG